MMDSVLSSGKNVFCPFSYDALVPCDGATPSETVYFVFLLI